MCDNRKKNKIGILTFHRALNFGAVLQAYALQNTLQMLGNECEIIDYCCSYIDDEYDLKKKYRKLSFLGKLKYAILTAPHIKKKKHLFEAFLSEKLCLSETKFDRSTIHSANEAYDAFITGSDQVWNDLCADFDPTYFLDFVGDTEKKFSYAASFGFEQIPEKLENEYKERLSGFKKISVRETSGCAILKKMIGKDVISNVDPVLLLSSEEWKILFNGMKTKYSDKKYILVYSVRKPIALLNVAKQIAEKTGCQIVYITPNYHFSDQFKDPTVDYLYGISPEEFVQLIYEAKYVLTNSFHGTAFSVVFHKQFLCEVYNKVTTNNRMRELLEMIGLDNRIIDKEHYKKITQQIDWKEPDAIIRQCVCDSLCYLKSIHK